VVATFFTGKTLNNNFRIFIYKDTHVSIFFCCAKLTLLRVMSKEISTHYCHFDRAVGGNVVWGEREIFCTMLVSRIRFLSTFEMTNSLGI
jgi:hypothetical protein